MKIREISASFGNLKNVTLELRDGLNVVEAPNESGKSTWCAFIRTMLYGLNSSERDRAGHIADKNRYRPWSGEAMGGTMEIEHGGRRITLQRSALGSAQMKKFSAVYTDTGVEIDGLNGSNAGEALTGVSEAVFERTAFIRQSGIQIDQTSDLEKRIASIISSGDEQQSYSEIDGLLRSWQRRLKYNKSGAIPQLEAELVAAEAQYDGIQKAADGVAYMRQEAERLKNVRAQLEDDLKTIEKLERRAEATAVWDAKRVSEEKRAELERVTKALTVNGRPLTREDTASLREACAPLPALEELSEKAADAVREASNALDMAESAKNASRIYPMSCSAAAERAARALELEKKDTEARARLISKNARNALFAIAALLILGAVGACFALKNALPSIAAAVGAAVGVFAFVKSRSADTSGEELAALLTEAGFKSAGELKAAGDEYAALCDAVEKAVADRDAAERGFEAAKDAFHKARDAAAEKVRLLAPDVSDVSLIAPRISKIEELIDLRARAEFESSAAENAFEALLSKHGGTMPELDETYIKVPMRSREDTESYLARIGAQLEEQNEKYNLAAGLLKAMGDPAVIGGRIKELRVKLAECREKYDALTTAIDVLSDANEELATRFSPLISEKASEIMHRLTGGRYEKLVFDRSFSAAVKDESEPVSRSALALSTGANDLLYLALRLAMCDTVMPEDEPCPIILDDALVNLDDTRAALALSELCEIAKKRQVILFTCHSREAKLLGGDKTVNITSVDKFN
ncbi:MAG: AAA family ATPase [Oscillospiraceae bacterium]|nr:AAA family ATPase [Oscillospiraceae bacterium]